MEYSRLRGEAGSDISLVDLGFQTDLRVYLHLRQTWMAFSESQLPPPVPGDTWVGVESPGRWQTRSPSASYSYHSEHP